MLQDKAQHLDENTLDDSKQWNQEKVSLTPSYNMLHAGSDKALSKRQRMASIQDLELRWLGVNINIFPN